MYQGLLRKLISCTALIFVLPFALEIRADVSIVTADGLRGAKEVAKEKGKGKARHSLSRAGSIRTLATGSHSLIDSSGLKFFINTNISYATSSSASGAASEASYTHLVAADTLNGGLQSTVLGDAFDGYGALCFNTLGDITACSTKNSNQIIYNMLGAAAADSTCIGSVSGTPRQFVLPVQTTGALQVQRKVFVPDNDSFIRWTNIFTNTGTATIPVTATSSSNLGSDPNTKIVATSSGSLPASVADMWVTSFQNFIGSDTTSPDVRLGHVLWGGIPNLAPAAVYFVDGSDNPFWSFTFNLAPGETKVILSFATGQPTRAAAAAKAGQLAHAPMLPSAVACMTDAEQLKTVNFLTPVTQAANGNAIPAASTTALIALAVAFAATGLFLIRRFV